MDNIHLSVVTVTDYVCCDCNIVFITIVCKSCTIAADNGCCYDTITLVVNAKTAGQTI